MKLGYQSELFVSRNNFTPTNFFLGNSKISLLPLSQFSAALEITRDGARSLQRSSQRRPSAWDCKNSRHKLEREKLTVGAVWLRALTVDTDFLFILILRQVSTQQLRNNTGSNLANVNFVRAFLA